MYFVTVTLNDNALRYCLISMYRYNLFIQLWY